MSGIAQGGRVWNFDKKAASVAKPGYTFKMFLLSMMIWTIAGVGVYLAGQHLPTYKVIQLDTAFAQEFGTRVEEGHNMQYLFISFGLCVSAFLANAVVLYSVHTVAQRFVLVGFVIGVVGLLAASALGMSNPVAQKPNPFAEWAEKTYGYSSIEKVESSSLQTVYEGVNAKGESVRFKVYYDGGFQYLYENVDQLQVVLDQVAEKKIAAEKKLSE